MRRILAICGLFAVTGSGGLATENSTFVSDPLAIEAESYRLCTETQALIWSEASYPTFIEWREPPAGLPAAMAKTVAALKTAERALMLDPQNAYAHALLARLYLVPLDTHDLAEESWDVLLERGLGVSFPAIHDGRPVLAHIRASGVFLFTNAQLGVDGGASPGPADRWYWEAHAGRIPASAEPFEGIAWSDVVELRSDARGWTFVRASGAEVTLMFRTELEGFPWDLDWYDFWYGEPDERGRTYGPANYHDRVRAIVLRSADPGGRIRTP